MPFIGNQPALSYTSFAKQDFTTSATTSYTLSQPVANENEIALFINFVRQEPTTAYTASGTSLTLTSATSGSDDMYAIFLGKAVQTVNPPAGSVGTSQLADASVTSAKLASGVGGKVLQVVSTTKTDTFSASLSNSFADVTGLSVSITPSSASNKILIFASVNHGVDGIRATALKLLRDSTDISVGTASGNRPATSTVAIGENYDTNRGENSVIHYLDSPATTSATTYKIQIGILETTANTARVNTSGADGDFTYIARASSTITVMEISA